MKACFFDIDGTLWDRKNHIPDSTKVALQRLKANGHKIFICSGRTRGFITSEELLSLNFDGIISGCGTMVEYEGERRFLREIDYDTAIYTVDLVREYGFRPILEGKDYLYMEEDEFGNDPYAMKLIRELGDRLKPIDGNRGQWEISKLSCDTSGCRTDECFRKLERIYDVIVHDPKVAEMVPKGYSKGTGIIKACEISGISISDTVAFGDSVNDLTMFDAAAFSVAMGSGVQAAKERADHITTGLNEDGIYNAVKALGFI